MRGIIKISLISLSAMAALTACVHEMPSADGMAREVRLNIHHEMEWSPSLEMTVTRSESAGYKARYHFKLYRAGDQQTVISEQEFFSDDFSRADFSTRLDIPPGDYDLWTWSDWADVENEKSLHFDSSDFSSVRYSEPYKGNNDLRDALRGVVSFSVERNLDGHYHKDVDLTLTRPLAKYEFIATDLADFIENESTRGKLTRSAPDLTNYRVRMVYTGYMPSEYNTFLDRPVNSKTGVSYDAEITALNEKEALLGFDYVLVNGHESSVPVAMEIYDKKGELIGRTNPIDVPTMRNRLTVVRGKFLTSSASGGVGINPDFNGDYNIEIK